VESILEKELKKHKPVHSFFLNSIIQGNMIYFILDLKNNRNFNNKIFFLVLFSVFMTMNFITNDILIPKIFYYDKNELYLPILNEFILFQKRFFRIEMFKRIISSKNEINFFLESDKFSKELLMDIKANSYK